LQGRQPRCHAPRMVRFVPQIGSGHLLFQVGDLSALAIWVDDSLNRAQSPIKVSECDGEVGSSHNDPLYLEVQLTSAARDGAAPPQKRPHQSLKPCRVVDQN
jgi:hypothetical protein